MVDSDDTPLTTFAEGYGDDPPASVLTGAQREYLFGKRELEGGSERAVKRRIRQRVRVALWDLSLLARVYPNEEIEKIRPNTGESTHPTEALASMLYRLQPENGAIAEDVHKDEDPTGRDRRAAWVEGDVSRGIEKVIKQREGVDAEVETTITVERGESLEALAERDLAELSRDELDTLLYTGTITREEYAEANERRLNRQFGGDNSEE